MSDPAPVALAPLPPLRETIPVWARIGLLSFGGPAGQIALMHRELVEERRWVDEDRYLHALNFCMLLPGPEAQQLATYVGWMMHGWRGGLVAGGLFVLPGLAGILALSLAYAQLNDTRWLPALFVGLKAAVLVIVAQAMVRVGRRALKSRLAVGLAVAAFIALFVFDLPFPLVILVAGLIGFFAAKGGGVVAGSTSPAPVGAGQTLRAVAVWGVVWMAPLAVLVPAFGFGSVFVELFLFFSRMAVVTFGGAYAVLAYVAQEAVVNFGWLRPQEMLDGLALAETTPGPLVLVLSFVGTLAGHRFGTGMAPVAAALFGGLLTAWATFMPSFLWIFAGAPHVERLRGNVRLAGALSAITAAVVGVILNLALWFALHVLFREVGQLQLWVAEVPLPEWRSLDPVALGLTVLASLLLVVLRLSVPWTLLAMALCGWLAH